MAGGLPSAYKLEVEFVSGTWVDITADWMPTAAVNIHVGRGSIFDSLQAGTLTAVLRNDAGTYTPDNPTSIRYPNVVENKRVRFTVSQGGIDYLRFLGYITGWDVPGISDASPVVTLTATDLIGRLGQQTLKSAWEQAWIARDVGQACECFPLTDDVNATSLRNLTGTASARILPGAAGAGSYSLGSADQGVMLPGAMQITTDSTGIGPTILVDLRRSLGTGEFTFGFKTTALAGATADLILAVGYNLNMVPQWSLRLSQVLGTGATNLVVFHEGGTVTMLMPAINGSDRWFLCSVYNNSGTGFDVWQVNRGNDAWAVTSANATTTHYVSLGGINPGHPTSGWAAAGWTVSYAGIAASTAETFGFPTIDNYDYADPLVTLGAQQRVTELLSYTGDGAAVAGSIYPLVTRTDTNGVNALTALDQLTQSIGGAAYHGYVSDLLILDMPDTMRPLTTALTIAAGLDDDAKQIPLALTRDVGAAPTRVTVSSPFGSVTQVDTKAETGPPPMRREETFTSCSGSLADAAALAGFRLRRSTGARFTQIPIDLVTSANDLWFDTTGVNLGFFSRITVTGLPGQRVGYTSRDMYAVGWTETYTHDSARFVFDTTPADQPPEFTIEDPVYGRLCWGDGVATVTSGTAVGTTANGTLVIATGSGPALTVDAAAYPLGLLWNGERVTITSAPASSTSPQTVTTTARGVAPTVARSHAAGENIDIWLPSTIAAI